MTDAARWSLRILPGAPKQTMQLFRSSHLDIVGSRVISTPTEFLDLYLDPSDVTALADPTRRYTMDRFMGCTDTGSIPGWSSEDKVHLYLRTPTTPDQNGTLAELMLDPGGDLYFTIWDSHRLRAAKEHEEFTEMSTFVTSDANDRLRAIGIEVIRLHQLSDLALVLAEL